MRWESESDEPPTLPAADAKTVRVRKRAGARLLQYFASLSAPRTILWCYAIWYGIVLVRYFDPSPRVWLTAIGLSGIVGLALVMSTRASLPEGSRLDEWGIFRLFLMPFCVSSFAALVKGRGFFLIFPPSWVENLFGFGTCAVFVGLVAALRRRGEGSRAA